MDPFRKAVKDKVTSRWTSDEKGPVLAVNIKGSPSEEAGEPPGLPDEAGEYGDGMPGDDEPDESVYTQLADEADALGVTEDEFPAWAADRLAKMKAQGEQAMPQVTPQE